MDFLASLSLNINHWVNSGENMELLAALNLEPIFQLTFIGLIVIAGPIVIAVLAFRGGDL